ncbi:MAG TPA: ROK family transcriptional regulator, partial [Longimicrobiales bacterium]
MRKINTRKFRRATRDTPREINRRIALNVIRDHEPISRADLSRRMQVSRSMISVLVDDLLAEGVIREGAIANTARGRKPRLLYVRTHDRLAVAVDVRLSRTHVALMNFESRQLAAETFETPLEPQPLVEELAARIARMLEANGVAGDCEGVGIVIPGMVDRKTGRVLNSPQLGWRDVDIREALAAATGMRVFIE